MGRKRKPKAVLGHVSECPKTNEAVLTRFIQHYFRVTNLGDPTIMLQNWALNKWFRIPHNDDQFGWLWFAYLCKLAKANAPIPSCIQIMAPYVSSVFAEIQYFVTTRPCQERLQIMPFLKEVNTCIHQIDFPDALQYGVLEDHEIDDQHRREIQNVKHQLSRPKPSGVLGQCSVNSNKEHGPFVISLQGKVCTACGQVGNRTFLPNFDTLMHAQSKQGSRSATGRVLTSKDTQLDQSDPLHRAMTRAQFQSWLQRPFSIVNAGAVQKKEERFLTRPYQTWLLYLFDFIKDHNIDRSRHTHKMVYSWTQAIWTYGYLMWITLLQDQESTTIQERRKEGRALYDAFQIIPFRNPLIPPSSRLLEYQYKDRDLQYLCVVGMDKYRFYPERFLEPQFVLNPTNPDAMYADRFVHHMKQMLNQHRKQNCFFWDDQYRVFFSEAKSIQTKPTLHCRELYAHLAISKQLNWKLVEIEYSKQKYKIYPWTDTKIITKFPNAQHFIVHIAKLRSKTTPCRIKYCDMSNRSRCKYFTVVGLDNQMKPIKHRIEKTKNVVLVRKAPLSLHFQTRKWMCHLNMEELVL